jgi:type I restriction enzyme M protein
MAKTKKEKAPKKAAKPVVIETSAQRLSGIIKTCRNIMRKDKGMNGDGDRLPMLTWIMFLKFLDDNENLQEVNAQLEGKKYTSAISAPYRWRDWAKDKNLTGDDLLAFINNEKVKLADGKERTGLFYYLRALQSETGAERKDVIATVFKGVTNRMINGYLLRDIINKIDEIHFTSNEELNSLSHLYESILKEMRDASGDAGEFYTPRPVVKFMVEMLDPKIGETVLDPACGTGGFLVEAFEHLKKQAKTVEHKKLLQEKSIIGGEAKPLPYLLSQMNLLLHGLNYPKIDSGNSLRFPLKDIGDNERVDIVLANPPFGGEEEKGILNNFPDDKQTTETALLFLQLIMRKLKRKKPTQEGGRAAIVVPDGILSGDGVCARIKKELLENFNLHTIVKLQEGVFHPYTGIPCNLLFFKHGKPTSKVWYYEVPMPPDRKNYSKTRPLSISEFIPVTQWWNKRKVTEFSWCVDVNDIINRNYNLDIKNPSKKLEDFSLTVADKVKNELESFKSTFSATNKLLLNEYWKSLNEMKTSELQEIVLCNVLKEKQNYETLIPSKTYNILGCSLAGRGPFLRETKLGQEISGKELNKVSKGNFLYSRLFAWKGAFGIIADEFDGFYCSNEFPVYEVDESQVLAEYLSLYFTRPFVWSEVEKYCKGTTKASRNRFKEEFLLAMKIRVPKIERQREILKAVSELNKTVSQINEFANSLNQMPLNILANLYQGEL